MKEIIKEINKLNNRLDNLTEAMGYRSGSTTACLDALQLNRDAILLVASQKRRSLLPGVIQQRVVTIEELLDEPKFGHAPLVVDPSALSDILGKLRSILCEADGLVKKTLDELAEEQKKCLREQEKSSAFRRRVHQLHAEVDRWKTMWENTHKRLRSVVSLFRIVI